MMNLPPKIGRKVAVTGASGYVASEIVFELLERGYEVHGTVRNLKDDAKVGHLKHRQEFRNGQLKLFEADLLQPGSFDEAFKAIDMKLSLGVEGVFHTASPVTFHPKDPESELIKPAVNGTMNVLLSVEKEPSIKVLICTSSVAAISDLPNVTPDSKVLTENDWNTTSRADESGAYALGKTSAERTVYDWAKIHPNVRVVTLCPAMIFGPLPSSRKESGVPGLMEELVHGHLDEKFANRAVGIVDLRDVAKAHILAFENETISGRFILSSEETYTFYQLARWLQEEFPQIKVERSQVKDTPQDRNLRFSNARAREILGITFTDPKKSFLEMARSFLKDSQKGKAETGGGSPENPC